MGSLQERKAKLEKEMKEIEALEKAQSIRDQEANKNELIERLLTDLRDMPLACALPLSSVSHVKSVFRQPACKGELCAFFDTCAQIISLTGKASPVKRSKGNGEKTYNKVATKDFKYKISGDFPSCVVFVTESPLGPERFEVNSNSCKGFRKILTSKYCDHGITGNQISGLTKVLNQKGFVLK